MGRWRPTVTARSAGDNWRRCFIQINTREGDPVSRGFVFFAYKKIARPNWDANLWQNVLSDGTNSFETSPETIEQELRPAVC